MAVGIQVLAHPDTTARVSQTNATDVIVGPNEFRLFAAFPDITVSVVQESGETPIDVMVVSPPDIGGDRFIAEVSRTGQSDEAVGPDEQKSFALTGQTIISVTQAVEPGEQ